MFLTKAFLIMATSGSLISNVGLSLSHTTAQNTNSNKIQIDSKVIDFDATMLESFKTSFMFNHPTEYQQLENITDFKINNLKQSNIEIKKVGEQILEFDDNKFNFMFNLNLSFTTEVGCYIFSPPTPWGEPYLAPQVSFDIIRPSLFDINLI